MSLPRNLYKGRATITDSHSLTIHPIVSVEAVKEAAEVKAKQEKGESYEVRIDGEKVRQIFPKLVIGDKIQVARYILHKMDMALLMNNDKKTRDYVETRGIIGYMLKVIDYEFGTIHDFRERDKHVEKIRELKMIYETLDIVTFRSSVRGFFCF
jgi:hypothetical protein